MLVVEEFQIKGKTTCRLLFSTDTEQTPIDAIDIYHTRFQIEFGFRDAKQFAGLENSFPMTTYKVLFHNALLLSRFLRLFAINPNSIKNHQHVKELLYFGTLAA